MPTDSSSSRPWFRGYVVDLTLLILLAVAAVGGAFYARHVEYVGGTRNSHGDGVWLSMIVMIVDGLAGLGFIARAITQYFRPPQALGHTLLQVACLSAVPAILVGGPLIGSSLAVPFLRGFEQWVLREVDTDAIQRWLAAEGHSYAGRQYDIDTGFPKELPDCLVGFKPGGICFRGAASEDGPCVVFAWGGGTGDWRLIVGLPDMPTPQEGAVDLSESEIEFRCPVKPGVYVVDRR